MNDNIATRLGYDGRRLSDDEERDLARLARAGDSGARQALVASQTPLAITKAAKYSGPMMPVDDLVQEALIGLMRATETFDPGEHGVRFSSYAIWWVMQAIFVAIEDMGGMIRVPQYIQRIGSRIARAEAEIRTRGEDVDDAEVARVCRIPESRLAIYRHFQSMGFLDSATRDRSLVMESIEAPRGQVPDGDEIHDLMRAIHRLPEVEAYVIKRRFGVDCPGQSGSIDVIAREFGYSRARVKEIEASAMRQLKVLLAA